MNRKGMSLSDLAPAAIAFVFIAVVVSIGAEVLGGVQDDQVTNAAGCNSTAKTACGADFNATQKGLESMAELGTWLPTIALVVAAAVVIGVLAFFRN